MEQLYQEFKDIAEFRLVYIREAHATDSRRPVQYAFDLKIKEHTSLDERCDVAKRLLEDKKLTIPCLIDNMDNRTARDYQSWPDRLFVVKKDGTIAVAADRGPRGFAPALRAARKWLEQYRFSLQTK